jgi:hypothetical protein
VQKTSHWAFDPAHTPAIRNRWTVRDDRVNVGLLVHVMSMYAKSERSGIFCSSAQFSVPSYPFPTSPVQIGC